MVLDPLVLVLQTLVSQKKIEFRHSGGEAGALNHRSISSVPEYLLLLVVVLIATITDWCQ